MKVSLIVARSDGGVIGRGNALPWHLPADLLRFKALTTGHTIIMGRRTYESIGRPLPDRRSVVISRNPEYAPEGVDTVGSLEEALLTAQDDDEAFIIGGAEVFREALPLADRLYLTVVHAEVEGDVSFPAIDVRNWRLVEREAHDADERNPHAYTFERYERRRFP